MSTDVEEMCRVLRMYGTEAGDKAAAMLRSLEDEAKVLRGTRRYMLDNEVIYKAQIENLHRLLGMLVHGVPQTPTYNKAYIEARELVLAAHMSGSTNGIANND